jgi:hypothetical protein
VFLMLHRLTVFTLVCGLMIVGVSLLSGFVFPLALHHLLKVVTLDHWVNWGKDYASGAIVVRALENAQHLGWWNAFVFDAKLQLSALPFFALLAAMPAFGVALWVAAGRRPIPLWAAAVFGTLPGFAIVVAVISINWSAIGETPIILQDAVWKSFYAVMWSWFVSRSLLVALGAMVCAWITNRLASSYSLSS